MASSSFHSTRPSPNYLRDVRFRSSLSRWGVVGGLGAILFVAALARPLNHDESQYVASAVLARSGLPYRDFDYLQTPLQPIVFAPLTVLWPGHILLVLRLTTAAFGLLSVLTLASAARKDGCSGERALAVGLLLAASEPFLFGASTVRNDMLPCLLECAALSALMSIARSDSIRPHLPAALLGMALGLACAAKISYAFPLAAIIPAELAARRRGNGRLSLPAFVLGASFPLALVAGLALAAPATFWFDVIHFPAAAPREWYAGGAGAGKLTMSGRVIDYLRFGLLGPAPILVILLIRAKTVVTRDRSTDWSTLMMDAMLAAAFLASLLTTPVWRQYLLPVLPLLVLRVGTSIGFQRLQRLPAIALSAFCAAGTAVTLTHIGTAFHLGFPVLAAERDAAEIRDLIAPQSASGAIASLSPERVVDTGFALDPRFAAGPFLFRTRNGLGEGAGLNGVTQATFRRRLEKAPPRSIVTGGEALDFGQPALDRALASWAITHGYTVAGLTSAGMTVLVRPRIVPASAP